MLIIMIYLVKNAGFPQLREVTKGFFFFYRFAGTRSDGELPDSPPVLFVSFCTRLTRFYIINNIFPKLT